MRLRLTSTDLLVQLVAAHRTAGKSQRMIAEQAGFHVSFLTHLMSGRRSTCSIGAGTGLADALDVNVTTLFTTEPLSAKQAA